MKLRRYGDRATILLILNTSLFGGGAALVYLVWQRMVLNQEAHDGLLSGLTNFHEPFLLVTIALLLAGIFHSFMVLYPTLIAQREEQQKVLTQVDDFRDQAHRDPLTKLHNRRYFDETLKAYFEEYGRMKIPFGLLVFDVDHFKKVNDTYGHAVGDTVLQEIALRSLSLKREHDVVARVGGEEFAVIVAFVTNKELLNVGERYRSNIEGLSIKHGKEVIKPTVSIGAVLSTEFDSTHDMLENADNRLYNAKTSGRNTVIAS